MFATQPHGILSLQAELINDNLFEWHVRLFHLDPESPLAQDMEELNVPSILLHLIFPDNFPFAPPFMRVVEPRIEKGFVMEGGAICMELLTPRGSLQWIFKSHQLFWFFLFRLGIGLHHRSHSHAVCCQLSQRSGQDLSQNESQQGIQQANGRRSFSFTRENSRQIRLGHTVLIRWIKKHEDAETLNHSLETLNDHKSNFVFNY